MRMGHLSGKCLPSRTPAWHQHLVPGLNVMMQVSLPSNRGTDGGSVAESDEATFTACNACFVLTDSDQEMLAVKG